MPTARKEPIELVLTARFHSRQLGRLLKAVRLAAGVTQTELARRLKVPYQNLGRLESGAREGMISCVFRRDSISVPTAFDQRSESIRSGFRSIRSGFRSSDHGRPSG